ncbi:MAG: hypothetical protein D6730_06345 [Bacteroidetes bacterium]|nr:MAG: hypothetical protein D6730_06345 [Bacteroidota bacterium]
MKHWLFFLIILACWAWSCRQEHNQGLAYNRAELLFPGNVQADSLKWRLLYTYDPYNGGHTIYRDSLNPKYLVLARNGTFKSYDTLQSTQGRWYLNSEKTALALIDQRHTSKTAPTDPVLYRHHIKKLTADSLILSWQGRHGMVEEVYIAERDSLQAKNHPSIFPQ